MSGDNTQGRRDDAPREHKMVCDASLAVGDLVFLSPTVANKALEATDNTTAGLIIGVVLEKPSSTEAIVLLRGPLLNAVAQGGLFLGTDGKLTATLPTSGFVQRLGTSFGTGEIDFLPSQQRFKRS